MYTSEKWREALKMANRCSHDYLLERMSFKCGSHLFREWENNLWILNSVSEWTFYMIIGRWTREICSWFPRFTSCLLWLGQITEDIFLFSLWVPGIPPPLLFLFLSTSFFFPRKSHFNFSIQVSFMTSWKNKFSFKLLMGLSS